MIEHLECYLEYIERKGVGAKDEVASSPKSYVSYLNSVSRLIGEVIRPDLLRTEQDVQRIINELNGDGNRAESTIRNYQSALRQYVAMVTDERL